MRVVLSTRILRANRTGIGNYVVELAEALQQNGEIDLVFFNGSEVTSQLSVTAEQSKLPTKWLRRIPGIYRVRRYREQRTFDACVSHARPSLYHDPSLWPLRFDGPTVMTVHDLAHIDFAWTQPAARIREINRELPRALEHVARILVDSQFIADQLQRCYNVSRNKIVVAPLAAADHFTRRRESQIATTLKRLQLSYRNYLMFVGTFEPRKNLLLALSAHAQLPTQLRRQFPLVIAGSEGWHAQNIERELASACAAGFALKLGYLEQEELADVVAGAKLFVFPSLYEGFGIPVLEAMASGVPVISSNAACLPEVGGNAARYIDPSDDKGLANVMLELIDDQAECERLIDAGIARAKLFSWEKCAAITANAYRAALM